MNKIISTIAAAAVCFALSAEIVKNPDPNTLWIENGKNAKTAVKHGDFCWGTEGKLQFKEMEKGFQIGSGGKLGTYALFSKQYPWFCFKIRSVERVSSGYHALATNLNLDLGVKSIVTKIPKGVYCMPLAASAKLKEKPSWNYMRFDFHNANITFDYIGMFKEPPCEVSLGTAPIKKGSDVTVTIKTKEPAEMVQLKFYSAYTMPAINVIPNVKRYLAKPVEGKGEKEWTFQFPYNGFKGVKGDRGSVVIEAVVETKDEVQSYFFFNRVVFE
jgi:hypothetical protein